MWIIWADTLTFTASVKTTARICTWLGFGQSPENFLLLIPALNSEDWVRSDSVDLLDAMIGQNDVLGNVGQKLGTKLRV